MQVCDVIFLNQLFTAIKSIDYAVLRGAEALPESLNGGDIDIVTTAQGLEAILKVLADVATSCGGKIVAQMKAPHFVQTELMGCMDGQWWGCCIDLFDGVYVKSVLPIAGGALLSRRVDNGRGVWTLPHDLGHYLGFVKELLVAGRRSSRYEDGAGRAIVANEDNILLSKRCRTFIRKVYAEGQTSAKVFVRSWMIGMAVRHPIVFCRDYLGFVLSRVVRYFKPCGKMIAVLGTDGSGKSTLLNEVMPLVKTMTHGSTIVHHLKPDLLPPLGRLRGVKYEPGHVCADPHGSKPSGFVGSLFRLTYLTCDYILGYWLKVRVKIAKTPIAYWIFDRYAYDILLDPRRFRIQLPRWIVKAYLFLIPTPDLIVCLGGDPEKIYARKPETSLEEVTRQVETLKCFADLNRKAIWVDTTMTLDESAKGFLEGLKSL